VSAFFKDFISPVETGRIKIEYSYSGVYMFIAPIYISIAAFCCFLGWIILNRTDFDFKVKGEDNEEEDEEED